MMATLMDTIIKFSAAATMLFGTTTMMYFTAEMWRKMVDRIKFKR